VPIPRRFDRRPPERDPTRINERIRVPEVRLIGDDGNQIGVVSRDEALRYAQQRDLDLVEVAPDARPPVCRVLDYSKYKYEQEQKAKSARRHQKQVTIREIKLRPKIAENDYETKKGHVERFLKHQDKVKVTIMFRGREMTHPERGERLLLRLAEDVGELGAIEQRPSQDGRNMTMTLAPTRQQLEGAEEPEEAPAAEPVDDGASRRRGSRRERGALPQQQEHRSADGAEAESGLEAGAADPAPEPEPEVAAPEPEAQPEPEPEAQAEPEPEAPSDPEPEPQAKRPGDAGASSTSGGF
jgi:translation initiation factor IF-3